MVSLLGAVAHLISTVSPLRAFNRRQSQPQQADLTREANMADGESRSAPSSRPSSQSSLRGGVRTVRHTPATVPRTANGGPTEADFEGLRMHMSFTDDNMATVEAVRSQRTVDDVDSPVVSDGEHATPARRAAQPDEHHESEEAEDDAADVSYAVKNLVELRTSGRQLEDAERVLEGLRQQGLSVTDPTYIALRDKVDSLKAMQSSFKERMERVLAAAHGEGAVALATQTMQEEEEAAERAERDVAQDDGDDAMAADLREQEERLENLRRQRDLLQALTQQQEQLRIIEEKRARLVALQQRLAQLTALSSAGMLDEDGLAQLLAAAGGEGGDDGGAVEEESPSEGQAAAPAADSRGYERMQDGDETEDDDEEEQDEKSSEGSDGDDEKEEEEGDDDGLEEGTRLAAADATAEEALLRMHAMISHLKEQRATIERLRASMNPAQRSVLEGGSDGAEAPVSRSPALQPQAARSPAVAAQAPRSPAVAAQAPRSPAVAAQAPRSPAAQPQSLRSPAVPAQVARSPAMQAQAAPRSPAQTLAAPSSSVAVASGSAASPRLVLSSNEMESHLDTLLDRVKTLRANIQAEFGAGEDDEDEEDAVGGAALDESVSPDDPSLARWEADYRSKLRDARPGAGGRSTGAAGSQSVNAAAMVRAEQQRQDQMRSLEKLSQQLDQLREARNRAEMLNAMINASEGPFAGAGVAGPSGVPVRERRRATNGPVTMAMHSESAQADPRSVSMETHAPRRRSKQGETRVRLQEPHDDFSAPRGGPSAARFSYPVPAPAPARRGGSIGSDAEGELLQSRTDLQNLRLAVAYSETLPPSERKRFFRDFFRHFKQPGAAASTERVTAGVRYGAASQPAPRPARAAPVADDSRFMRAHETAGPSSSAQGRGWDGGDRAAFESLKETIYKEVAVFIAGNESRPHFLVQLFRQLQLVNTDYLRQRVLFAVDDACSGVLSGADRPLSAGGRRSATPDNEPYDYWEEVGDSASSHSTASEAPSESDEDEGMNGGPNGARALSPQSRRIRAAMGAAGDHNPLSVVGRGLGTHKDSLATLSREALWGSHAADSDSDSEGEEDASEDEDDDDNDASDEDTEDADAMSQPLLSAPATSASASLSLARKTVVDAVSRFMSELVRQSPSERFTPAVSEYIARMTVNMYMHKCMEVGVEPPSADRLADALCGAVLPRYEGNLVRERSFGLAREIDSLLAFETDRAAAVKGVGSAAAARPDGYRARQAPTESSAEAEKLLAEIDMYRQRTAGRQKPVVMRAWEATKQLAQKEEESSGDQSDDDMLDTRESRKRPAKSEMTRRQSEQYDSDDEHDEDDDDSDDPSARDAPADEGDVQQLASYFNSMLRGGPTGGLVGNEDAGVDFAGLGNALLGDQSFEMLMEDFVSRIRAPNAGRSRLYELGPDE